MFGNVTALEGLHVIREIQELKYDARMLQAWRLVFSQAVSPGVRSDAAERCSCGGVPLA